MAECIINACAGGKHPRYKKSEQRRREILRKRLRRRDVLEGSITNIDTEQLEFMWLLYQNVAARR